MFNELVRKRYAADNVDATTKIFRVESHQPKEKTSRKHQLEWGFFSPQHY